MEVTNRDEIIANLRGAKINDAQFNKIQTFFPLAKICPTCGGRGKYALDFETFECDCELQALLQKHYFVANIGREYHDICLSHFEGPDAGKVVSTVQEYIDHFDDKFHYGLGLTFRGPRGTGKTFAMVCVLKELVKQGRNAYLITFEELINIWGASYHDDESRRLLEHKLKSVDLLGLDELRSDPRNAGGFLANGLDSVIRHRTANLLPTIITTNMDVVSEKDQFAGANSLLSARNEVITTLGHDRRMKEVRTRIHELSQRGERRPIC